MSGVRGRLVFFRMQSSKTTGPDRTEIPLGVTCASMSGVRGSLFFLQNAVVKDDRSGQDRDTPRGDMRKHVGGKRTSRFFLQNAKKMRLRRSRGDASY